MSSDPSDHSMANAMPRLYPTTNSARNLTLEDPVDLISPESLFMPAGRAPLGSGGYGEVFYAELTGVPVAVKRIVCNGDDEVKKVEREVQIQQRVRDPRAISVYGWCAGRTAAGGPDISIYIVMELAEGGSLHGRIHGGGGYAAFPLAARLRLLWQVAAVLSRLHAGNLLVHGSASDGHTRSVIVHGDLKPTNILLSRGGVPKLADFGLASVRVTTTDATLVGAQRGCGTPEYLCPTLLAAAPYRPASDVYALGIIAWETLSGAHPYADYREEVAAELPNGFVAATAWRTRLLEAVQGATGRRPSLRVVQDACREAGLPAEGQEILAELLRSCWAGDPSGRCDANSVAVVMQTLAGMVGGGEGR